MNTMRGWAVFRHELLDSTNLEAQRLLRGGLRNKAVIVAEEQSAGYGRGSHTWNSAPGLGLWASFIWPVTLPPEMLPQSSLVLAVAVAEAVSALCEVRLETKWPNDLLHEGRKCCGLLSELGGPCPGEAGALTYLVLGAGINVNHQPGDFPPELRPRAASLRMVSGTEQSREKLLQGLAHSLSHWFTLWEKRGFAPVRRAWTGISCTVGRHVSLQGGGGGLALGLTREGALLLRSDEGGLISLDSGEIIFSQQQ